MAGSRLRSFQDRAAVWEMSLSILVGLGDMIGLLVDWKGGAGEEDEDEVED